MIIYHLFYERDFADREDIELSIGFFLSEREATGAIEKLKVKPGFKDYPEGFVIDEVTLGHYGFVDGFESILGPPPKDRDGEMFDLPL